MTLSAAQPIGIFDSGVGGLTHVHAVAALLPHEDFIYFGDTARLPYGDKSVETIKIYCQEMADFFLSQACKVILIACNTATAAAYEFMCEYVGDKAHVIGVVEPVVQYIANNFAHKKIGLIGTRQTVNSQVFAKKLAAYNKNIQLSSLATPLLVPVIEEGFYQHQNVVDAVLQAYLDSPQLQNIEALVLACTHYPLLKNRIDHFYQGKVVLIDAPNITAKYLQQFLLQHQLLNTQSQLGSRYFYFSDYTDNFSLLAKYFFGEEIKLELKKLGE